MADDPYRFWEGPGPAPDEWIFEDDVPDAADLADMFPPLPHRQPVESFPPYDPETDPF